MEDFVLSNHILADIAAKRAQLLLLQRRLLKKEALTLGWSVDYSPGRPGRKTVSDEESAAVEGLQAQKTTNARYVPSDLLGKALSTGHAVRHTYEELSLSLIHI